MQQKDYKTVKIYLNLCIMSCLQQLFKYTSLATLGNLFQESQDYWIHYEFNYKIIQNPVDKNVTKQHSKHYCNTMYIAFMHGWLVQVELYGVWFLEVVQLQLVYFY